MPPLSVLIKPASGACNLHCRYCFYRDETEKREVASYGMMTDETLEKVIAAVFGYADGPVTIGFQGGEPTLRGLPFFENCVSLVRRYNTRALPVQLALQTNGTLLDEHWAEFLAREHFLVGVSLDGTKAVHERFRGDNFDRVLTATKLLEEHKVDYNILTVVTAYTARNIDRIYAFYRKNCLLYQQYIPCLDPMDERRGQEEYSLTPQLYARFLRELFDLWYKDIRAGRFIYIRHLENLVGILQGRPPENCGMSGHCAMQTVVEADGSVYPCDFYVLDRYRLGNLNRDSLETVMHSPVLAAYLAEGENTNPDCKGCPAAPLCNGGCRRDRIDGRNYYCSAYRQFYPYALPKLYSL